MRTFICILENPKEQDDNMLGVEAESLDGAAQSRVDLLDANVCYADRTLRVIDTAPLAGGRVPLNSPPGTYFSLDRAVYKLTEPAPKPRLVAERV